MTTLTVVTPWRDHRELERDYWAAMRGENAQVIVVDDGSVQRLPNALRGGGGFHRSCNVGLAAARSDAVVFLNNDIRLIEHGWADAIRSAVEPGVLVGAELRGGTHTIVDGVEFPYLDGWCLAGMRDDLLELGGWDESYQEPAYFGDNDLCLRARAVGMVLREVRVGLEHLRNRTAGSADDPHVAEATRVNRERFASVARQILTQ